MGMAGGGCQVTGVSDLVLEDLHAVRQSRGPGTAGAFR